jgi:hypothetical protein
MNYKIIEKPPENENEFVTVKPTENRDEFLQSLVALLKQKTFQIRTAAIPIEWAVAADNAANVSGYLMMLLRVPVNMGELGTAHAIFYFVREPEKKSSN